jgi:hypothetical protein
MANHQNRPHHESRPIVRASPRRGRQRVASGEEASETRRNPRYEPPSKNGRAERDPSQRLLAEATLLPGSHHTPAADANELLSPRSRLGGSELAYHGLTPMATCCRPLRGLGAIGECTRKAMFQNGPSRRSRPNVRSSPRRGRQRVASGEEASETRRNPRLRTSEKKMAEQNGIHPNGCWPRPHCFADPTIHPPMPTNCCRRVRGSGEASSPTMGLRPWLPAVARFAGWEQRHPGPLIFGNAVLPNDVAEFAGWEQLANAPERPCFRTGRAADQDRTSDRALEEGDSA